VLRRFEIYAIDAAVPAPSVTAFEDACAGSGRFIPEVLYSKVGRNLSDAPVRLVWEHAFDSVEAYRRYMVHPYHAAVLDRYLLHDSPERIVQDDDLGAGLVGYHCDGPVFDMAGGVRRLVFLRVERHASPAEMGRLEQALGDAARSESMPVSVVSPNTLGAAWFDAVTPMAGRPRWTHLWEQGFDDLEAFEAYRDGASPAAEAERRGWVGSMDEIVRGTASVLYELDPLTDGGVVHE
jgi:hypothetical protein